MKILKPTEPKQEVAIIKTYRGLHIDLLSPETASGLINIDDIAWALSGISRYNAHTNRIYSVAEHCLLGVPYCLPQNRLEFLLHDAPEAYLGDIVGPIKNTSIYAAYRALEERWWVAIAERFGVRASLPKEIAAVDKKMRVTEQRDLMGRRPSISDSWPPFAMTISPVAPSRDEVASHFLDKFLQLTKVTVGAKR